jgi:hypothetical protein
MVTYVDHDDEQLRERLEIARLLDERYRLREDPDRRPDLLRTHEQLSKLLHDSVVAITRFEK